MNKIINKYILRNFTKTVLIMLFIFFCLGIILNLFEEIEYFKKYETGLILPTILTIAFLPNLVLNLLPFIIFLSAILFFRKIKNNKDLLSLKVFGVSNLNISFLTSNIAFAFGLVVIVAISPITSSLLQYYETTKAKYSDEVTHLISFNKNGIWIKDNFEEKKYIISAKSIENTFLNNISIYEFTNDNKLIARIDAKSAEITEFNWKISSAYKYNFVELSGEKLDKLSLNSNYNLDKINSIFKNTNTLSFFNLVNNYHLLVKKGYNKEKLIEKIHHLLSLPVYLFLMVLLASIFMLYDLKRSNNNISIFFLSIFTCVVVYYLKDLSMALGQTGKINLILSVWSPIIILTLINSIGILQINEK